MALPLPQRSVCHIRSASEDLEGALEVPPLTVMFLPWRCPACLRVVGRIIIFLAACQEVTLAEGGLALLKGLNYGLLHWPAFEWPFSPHLHHHIDRKFDLEGGAGEKLKHTKQKE